MRYIGIMVNEAKVEIAESQKTLNITFGRRGWPFSNSFDFNRVHSNLAISNDNSKIFDFGFIEFTFLRFEIEFVFSETFHNFMNMFVMLFEVVVEDKNIVKVNENMSLRDFNMENLVHHRLKCGRGIGKAKEHNEWFKESSIGSECGFGDDAIASR